MKEKILYIIVSLLTLFSGVSQKAHAFSPDTYAGASVLSEGMWHKIGVGESGLYILTAAELKRMGFNDIRRVRVYGYGSGSGSDILSRENYIDDLSPVPQKVTDNGVVFYAKGPGQWSRNHSGRWLKTPDYYTTEAYYFVTENDSDTGMPSTATPEAGTSPVTEFTDHICHETETVNPGLTGHRFLGEDFTYTRSRTFDFRLTDLVSSDVWINCAFATASTGGESTVKFTVNGNTPADRSSLAIPSTINDSHHHYTLRESSFTVTVDSENMKIGLSLSASGTLKLARLDNITVNYRRALKLHDGYLSFSVSGSDIALDGADGNTVVWDVTDYNSPLTVNAASSSGKVFWQPSFSDTRDYAAWNPGARMRTPADRGIVEPQNLHAMNVPDMLIVTVADWMSQAEQLADLHRNSTTHPLDVAVVDAEKIYNEFSSGSPHFNGIRHFIKMLWDRGGGSATTESKLRYVLMFGRGIYDHRRISPEINAMQSPVLPQWQSIDGSSDNTSFTSEDYLSFMLDGAGASPATDRYCIATGRIPVTNTAEATATVKKIEDYMLDNGKSDWKNAVVLAADDGDAGEHLQQMESVHSTMTSHRNGKDFLYHKVYVDAFPLIDREAKEAHDRMFNFLNRGAVWWWYIGHANTYSWTSEGLLTQNDLNTVNFSHRPMLYAATCDFLRWDLLEESGAEIMFFSPDGIIGAIAATRPVYIRDNANMSTSLADVIFDTDKDGSSLPIGNYLLKAKNKLTSSGGDENKLRYVLLGDPALRLATSPNKTVIDKMDGKKWDPESQPTFKARQEIVLEGRVTDIAGNTLNGFSGTIIPTLYDAEFSTTTLGHNGEEPITFEEQGDRLFVGKEPVTDGKFSINLSMPGEISHNFRPAALNLYAFSEDGTDASSVNRDFYVFGYDESATDDSQAPAIEMFVLNSDDFTNGADVNESPVVIARVSDDVAINISSAGVGHQMSLRLDGSKSFPDLHRYYTPGDLGPRNGSIRYQLDNLSPGSHSLRLRVWDTSNNMAEETIDFHVVKGLPPKIISLYADVNPAVDHANFYIKHNRPDAVLDITLTVYDLMGRPVWTTTQSGRSDMFVTNPIYWDLNDLAGRRLDRGIYVYKAVVSIDGEQFTSASRKLAVAAR